MKHKLRKRPKSKKWILRLLRIHKWLKNNQLDANTQIGFNRRYDMYFTEAMIESRIKGIK